MKPIVVNGRFLTRPQTGVERVAYELTRELELLSEASPGGLFSTSIALPRERSASLEQVETAGASTESTCRFRGHLWEQAALAVVAPKSWLLSLCNTGPMFRQRQLILVHDAQVFLNSEAYSPLFRRWYRIMLPKLARTAGVVVTVSEHSKKQLESLGIVPVGKTHVIPNGGDHILRVKADNHILKRFGLNSHGYILAVGSLATHKNLELLTRAARARGPHVLDLVIAGGGNPAVFAQSGLTEGGGVRVLGRVTDGELRALYQKARALAFPSITEGFGLPPLEAMNCGCPVVASTGGAIPEACGKAALYVDPGDQEAWTAALERIERDEALRIALIEKGYRQAAQLTWRTSAIQVLTLLAQTERDNALMDWVETAETKNCRPTLDGSDGS